MYRVNTCALVISNMPSLLSVTRNGFQRTVPTVLKSLSPHLRNMNTYTNSVGCLSGPTNNGACSARSMPGHSSSFTSVVMLAHAPFSTSSQNNVKQKIMALKTVSELLDLFETSKKSFDVINSVAVLHTIAKVVWKDSVERNELQKHRGSSPQGCSVFRDLLNQIADNVTNLDKKHKDDIIWSLDKIQEFNHRLYHMANK